MSQTDEIVLGLVMVGFAICITFSGTAQAWDSEGGMTEDELFDIMFNSAYMYTDIDNPKWYDPVLAKIDDWMVSYEGYFTHTPPEMTMRIQVKKLIWTGAAYVEDTDFVDLDSSTYHTFSVNATETVQIPVLKPMQKVFTDNPNEFEDFKTVNDDMDHPDILNVSVEISADGSTLDHESYGYVTFTNDALNEIQNQAGDTDYGFDLDGRGADGGSGSIYEGIDMYGSGAGDESGMGAGFGLIFYGLIPIIFLFAVFKMSQRVLGGGE